MNKRVSKDPHVALRLPDRKQAGRHVHFDVVLWRQHQGKSAQLQRDVRKNLVVTLWARALHQLSREFAQLAEGALQLLHKAPEVLCWQNHHRSARVDRGLLHAYTQLVVVQVQLIQGNVPSFGTQQRNVLRLAFSVGFIVSTHREDALVVHLGRQLV